MSDAKIQVATDERTAQVRVHGRATFTISQGLRDFGLRIMADPDVKRFLVDLSDCTTMDSTFMGVLAMVGVKGRARNLPVEIVNASDNSKRLLCGLGLRRLFVFSQTPAGHDVDWESICAARADDRSNQQMILDAHRQLMDIDPDNVPIFQDVVDFLQAGLDQADAAGNDRDNH